MGKSLVAKQYDDFIWELKYRPDVLDKIILPDYLVTMFNNIKNEGKLPNMLFSGPAGCGKTTVAFVLADVMNISALYMNMSMKTGIDEIRDKLMGFASSVSMDGRPKLIIGDEFDRLSAQAMDSLKGAIEKMSNNCKFIFTSNHKGKIIEPIMSRLTEIDFIFSKEDSKVMKKRMWKAACEICHKEEVIYEKRAVAAIVKEKFPDMRKILNHLQKLSLQGDITMEAVEKCIATDIDSFFKFARDNDWSGIRQYVADIPIPWADFYTVIYNNVESYAAPESMSEAIVMIAKYQYESSIVVDKEIPLAALAMSMMDLEYKKDF